MEKFWEKRVAKKGVLLDILRGYNSLGLVLGLGSGVQRGTFGARWSARPRQLVGWQKWFGLVEFHSLGRSFGCRKKQGEAASKDINNGGSTSYLQVFFRSLYGNFVYLNIKGFYVVIIPCYLHN